MTLMPILSNYFPTQKHQVVLRTSRELLPEYLLWCLLHRPVYTNEMEGLEENRHFHHEFVLSVMRYASVFGTQTLAMAIKMSRFGRRVSWTRRSVMRSRLDLGGPDPRDGRLSNLINDAQHPRTRLQQIHRLKVVQYKFFCSFLHIDRSDPHISEV